MTLAALVDRFPGMKLAVERDELRWRYTLMLSCLEELPVLL